MPNSWKTAFKRFTTLSYPACDGNTVRKPNPIHPETRPAVYRPENPFRPPRSPPAKQSHETERTPEPPEKIRRVPPAKSPGNPPKTDSRAPATGAPFARPSPPHGNRPGYPGKAKTPPRQTRFARPCPFSEPENRTLRQTTAGNPPKTRPTRKKRPGHRLPQAGSEIPCRPPDQSTARLPRPGGRPIRNAADSRFPKNASGKNRPFPSALRPRDISRNRRKTPEKKKPKPAKTKQEAGPIRQERKTGKPAGMARLSGQANGISGGHFPFKRSWPP